LTGGDGLGRVFTISTPVRARDGQIETGVRMRPPFAGCYFQWTFSTRGRPCDIPRPRRTGRAGEQEKEGRQRHEPHGARDRHGNSRLIFARPYSLRTANSAERTLMAGLWEKSAASIGSNGSTSSGDFSEIEETIHRLCDARSDDVGNRAALLSDWREYRPERWPCLIGYFNVEVAKYEATSGAENQG
jgi:hypothetical protein